MARGRLWARGVGRVRFTHRRNEQRAARAPFRCIGTYSAPSGAPCSTPSRHVRFSGTAVKITDEAAAARRCRGARSRPPGAHHHQSGRCVAMGTLHLLDPSGGLHLFEQAEGHVRSGPKAPAGADVPVICGRTVPHKGSPAAKETVFTRTPRDIPSRLYSPLPIPSSNPT